MRARPLFACAAAIVMAVAPAAAAPPPAPAAEAVEGSGLRSDAALYVLPLLIVIALLIAILAGEDGEAAPASP